MAMALLQDQNADTPKTPLELIDARYFPKRRRQLLAEKVAVTLGVISLIAAVTFALRAADHHYAQQSLINQERIHVARR